MTLIRIIAVFWALALAAASPSNNRCLSGMGEHPFDTTLFSGEWFVVAALFTNTKLPVLPPCVKVTYSMRRDSNVTRIALKVTTKVADKVEVIASSLGEPIVEGRDGILMAMWRNDKNESTGEVLQQSVLMTDYVHYAVFYACVPVYLQDIDSFSKREVVHIWSRLPAINDALLGPIKEALRGYDMPVERLIMADNTVC